MANFKLLIIGAKTYRDIYELMSFYDENTEYPPYWKNENKNEITTYNPNSRLNSWRYINFLYLKDGKLTYSAKKKDIDWKRLISDKMDAYILRGRWYERHPITWFGQKLAKPDPDWVPKYRQMLNRLKVDTILTTIEYTF